MLTKVFSTAFNGLFKSKPTTLSNNFTFCTHTGQRHESHPLRNKIMSLSSFDQFNNFFKEKKQDFDASCYSMASRTLAKILIESKMTFSFNHRESLKAYLTHLQKIDIDALSLQQFSQLLYLLRIIKLDPNNNTSFVGQFVRSILERSDSKLKELELDSTLSRLCYFYQEYSSLGSKQASALARRINGILQSNNSQVEFQHLTINEINLLLKGMRSKQQISNDENLLLRTIVKTVLEKYFDKLSFFELAQISVGINEISSLSFSDHVNSSNIEQIHKKVLSNIDEMDEKSIMYILNGKKTNNRTYNHIYKVIFEKIMDQIQPNGDSSFNELFTLRLFNGVSDKVRLTSTTPENQQKFFAFFRSAITKTPRFINSFLENYIEKGFFNYQHLHRVQEILESIPDFHYRLTLLHKLTKRRINVEKLMSMQKLKDLEMRDRNLVMMISILESLVERDGPNKQKFIEFIVKLKERFMELYKLEDDSFSKLVFGLDSELVSTMYRTMRKQIEAQFPNPFETEQSEKYRSAWLKVLIHGNSQYHFTRKQLHTIKQKLTAKDFEVLLRSFSIDGYAETDSLSNLLGLVSKRLDLFLENNNLVSSLTQLMNREVNTIFEDNSSEVVRSRYWHILNDYLEKAEPQRFFDYFTQVINLILKSSTYQFRYSSQYQSFLLKILQKAEFIKNRYVTNDLLDECLKLNLIKREMAQNLNQKVKDNALNNQKLLLKMIESNDFALEGVALAKSNLHLFLFNLSPESISMLSKNMDQVTSIIEQLKPREVWKCITHFRLGSKRNESTILDALFKQMTKYTLFFEEFSPIFAAEVLRRNNFDKFYVKIDNAKIFLKNSMEYFIQRRNIHKIPLEDHIELIKSANDFKVRNDDYIHAVFEKYSTDHNLWKRELYLVAGNVGLELNKKELQRLVEQNFFTGFTSSFSKCFSIFLLNEKHLEKPAHYLQNLITKYNELKEREKVPIYSLHYDYLKKTYPEETKNWQPNHIEKADFCRSLESLNSKNLNSLRETMEEITGEKWVENVISSNYYYTFRKIAFIFPIQSKYHGDNLLVKRILTSLIGIDKIVLINRRQTNTRSAVRFINQTCGDVLTVEEETNIMNKLDHKFDQNKPEVEGEQVEEIAQKTEEQSKQ